jgi:hypothetical protein
MDDQRDYAEEQANRTEMQTPDTEHEAVEQTEDQAAETSTTEAVTEDQAAQDTTHDHGQDAA